MHVLGMLNQCRTTVLAERRTPVDGAGTYADGTVPALPGDLDRAVEQLLHRPGPTLDPVLLVQQPEVLRRLDDSDHRIGLQVRKQLVEQIRARSEVGVEDEDVLPKGLMEPEQEIPGLLE